MNPAPAPSARSPSTNGSPLMRITSPRTTRENPVHEVTTTAMSMLVTPGSRSPASAIIRLKLGMP